ncbi:MAG: sialidase family protein, partial [Thermoplasmata archaeon]
VQIVTNSFTGESDETDYPIVSDNAIILKEIYELPPIVPRNEVRVETAILKVVGSPHVGKIFVETTSNDISASVEYRGTRYPLSAGNSLLQASLGTSFGDGDSFSIYATPSSLAPGELFGLTIHSIEVSDGYFWKKSAGTNNRAYVESPPASAKIDGAFGEWSPGALTNDYDDTKNPSIDLRQIGKIVENTGSIFFYLQMAGEAFAGRAIPESTPEFSGIVVESDSDRDTIPDSQDPLPFDFNNDGIPDASSNNDVDGDGVMDYPYGTDYYLNTTIPDDQRFPQEWRGKFVSIYIGPISQPSGMLAGLDYVRVYVDADANASTGYGVSVGIGAEMLLEITGREGEIFSSAVYEWKGKWMEAGELSAAHFGKQVEFGGVKLTNPGIARYYLIASDWFGETDATELKSGMRSSEEIKSRVFDTNIRVNANTNGWQIWPDLAFSSDGTVYAVWESNETGYYAIYLSKSYDGGLTWTTPVKIPYSDNGSDPAIAVYGSGASATVHVAFVGSALGGGGAYPDLYYARSTDGGETFTTVILDSSYYSSTPDICVDTQGYVYIVYTNWFFLFDADVRLMVSTNMGASFGSSVTIAGTGTNEYFPAVAVEGSGASSTLHVAYTLEHYNESGNQRYDTDVLYRKVTNAGSSPGIGSPVTVAGAENYSEYCISNSIAVDGIGNIHLVYTFNYTYYDYDVYYARSTTGGSSFTTTNLVGYSLYDEYEPRIAIDDENNPHIVWQDNRSGNYDIWYTNSSNNGESFLPYNSHVKVNKDTTTQSQACATVLFVNAQNARKELCVAWADRRSGDWDIYFANGTNRVYLAVSSQYGTPSGGGWYTAGSTASASVQGIVYDSATVRHVCTGFTGTGSAPSSGTTNFTSFSIYRPSTVTFNWLNQYYCQITFTGTDAQHTVNGSYVVNASTHNIAGIVESWAGWCDENTVLYFHPVTSPQQNYTTDPHSWVVTGPITAVIHYSSPAAELQSALVLLPGFLIGFLCLRRKKRSV